LGGGVSRTARAGASRIETSRRNVATARMMALIDYLKCFGSLRVEWDEVAAGMRNTKRKILSSRRKQRENGNESACHTLIYKNDHS
jgi:hypothetical protein